MLVEVPSSLYSRNPTCCHKITPALELIYYDNNESISKYRAKLNKNIFLFILKGSKNISLKDQDITLSEGYGAFVKQDVYLMTEIANPTHNCFSSLMILVDNEKLIELWKNASLSRLSRKETCPSNGETENWAIFKQNSCIESSLNALKLYAKHNKKVSPFFIEAKLQELLFYIVNSSSNSVFEKLILDQKSKNIYKLKTFMEENYDKPWSINEFASNFNLSLSSFKRFFKTVYDCPPKNWITQKKLEKAASKIIFEDKPITEIALDSGFSGSSQFSRAFKKQFNCKPSDFNHQVFQDINSKSKDE